MQPFPYACSIQTQWQDATRECLDALLPLTGPATLGFVYATDAFADHFAQILARLREETGVPHWVGTVGVGIVATGRELLDQPALAVMLADLPEASFRVLPNLCNLNDLLRHEEDCRIGGQPAWFGVVHGDPRNPLIAELIEHVAARTETGFLVGGLTSSRDKCPQAADQVVDGGLTGVLFDPGVSVVTRLTQGVSPLGTRHLITAAEQNVIRALDGRPPLEVLREDIGETLYAQLERLGGYLFVGLPSQDSDTDDYLVRHIVGIDPDSQAIAVGDYVEAGQPLMFCRRDGHSAVEDMQRMLDALKAGLRGEPRGALYFSCLGRGASMFGETDAELRMISRALGDIPLVGFSANGEISRNRLYGYTGVLAVFA
ncbi:MAG: FIST C-terminal domain-containing protein [Thiobacillaceae bacterium]|jgi:small ligand-binding sensory domain FIST|nr:FIST C-terminal domain-containing protein [Thiobacillaceae bacterium]